MGKMLCMNWSLGKLLCMNWLMGKSCAVGLCHSAAAVQRQACRSYIWHARTLTHVKKLAVLEKAACKAGMCHVQMGS
jgi:hypothetical protein